MDDDLEKENARLRRQMAQAGIDAAASDVVGELQKAVIGELHHRVKNLLSMVASIASQSIRSAKTLLDAEEAVHGRIMALARSYDALRQDDADAAPIAAILQASIESFGDGQRFSVSVPDIALTPSAAMSIALVINELGTNAVKYGALSTGTGQVDVTGTLNAAGDTLHLVWTETGGPTVGLPRLRSFGTKMIEATIPEAVVHFDYRPTGLVCKLSIPMRSLT